jgi:hypothetical protein
MINLKNRRTYAKELTMSAVQILQLAVAILFGGVAASILNYFFTERRNRIQPIGCEVKVQSIAPQAENWRIDTSIILKTDSGQQYVVDHLFLATISVTNQTNKDFDLFNFGITLPRNVTLLDTTAETIDRHHQIEVLPSKDPKQTLFSGEGLDLVQDLANFGNNLMQEHDFVIKPFNRKDSYSLRLVIAPIVSIPGIDQYRPTAATIKVGDIKIGTSEVGVSFRDTVNRPHDPDALLKLIACALMLILIGSISFVNFYYYTNNSGASGLISVTIVTFVIFVIASPRRNVGRLGR